ncbi:GDP-mannose 4,6-dehydratase [Lutibacter sp. B2]|nr:GDP-mannose 4,6-dehydratase [Lutibacter sp. B2]
MIQCEHWKNRNVFITGATGFLGSHIGKALIDLGANVTGLIRDFVSNSNICEIGYDKKINWVKGYLEDIHVLERALGEYEIDTVFHLGAQAIVGIANRNPISTFEANILGTCNILEACRRSPLVKNIIVASSDKAYGNQKDLPYDENLPLQGRYPYDVSKSCADLIAQSYYHTYKLPVCITRCGNLYGGGDLNFNRIIPQTINSILNDHAPVIRSDGTLIRDYFYIEDAVEAYLLLAEKMEEFKLYGEAFNFSNENRLTVLGIVERILNIMDSDLKPIILNQGNNEIKYQYLSAKKAKEILKWESIFNIDEGLKRTVRWYKNK